MSQLPHRHRFTGRRRGVALATAALLLGSSFVLGGALSASADGGTASVSGTVTGSDAPQSDVDVQITSQSGYFDDVTTGDDGSYTLSNIPAGSYTLDFLPGDGSTFVQQWWNDQPTSDTATYFDVADGAVLQAYNADLAPGGTVSGTVTGADAPSVGLENVDVSVNSVDGTFGADGTTDSDGNYSVTGLPANSYKVVFTPSPSAYVAQWWQNEPTEDAADPITVAAGSITSHIDASLAVGATISGTVDVAGSPAMPLAGAAVTAFDSHQVPVATTTADDSGDYTIVGLPAASYRVQFAGPDGTNYGAIYWKNENTFAKANPVAVTAATPGTGINATLKPGANISGAVYAPGKKKVGLSDVTVSVFAASGGAPIQNVVSGEHGKYTVSGLPAGKYTVGFEPDFDAHAAVEWWGGSFTQKHAKSLTVKTGKTRTGISQHLVTGSRVTGTVKEDGGAPYEPADVTLWPSDQHYGSNDLPPFETFTDESGHFSFSNIGPGTYTVEFTTEDSNFIRQWWKNKPSQAKGTKLIIKLDKTRSGVNATLKPAL